MGSARSVPRHARSLSSSWPGFDGEQERGILDRVECVGLGTHHEEVARDGLQRLRPGGQPDVAREHLRRCLPRAVVLVQRGAGSQRDDGLRERAVVALVRPSARYGRTPRSARVPCGPAPSWQATSCPWFSSRSVGVSREGRDACGSVVTDSRAVPSSLPPPPHESERRDRVLHSTRCGRAALHPLRVMCRGARSVNRGRVIDLSVATRWGGPGPFG
jgi:hypothetical protein